MDRETLARVDATVRSRGFRYIGPGVADYEGQIPVHGKLVDVRLEIPDLSFVRMPVVRLLDRSQIAAKVLAHWTTSSSICYYSAVGLPLDMYAPGEAILRVLADAQATLELSTKRRTVVELVNEYQAYWKGAVGIRCFLGRRPPGTLIKCTSFFAYRGPDLQFIGLSATAKLAGYSTILPSDAWVFYSNEDIGPTAELMAPKTLAELKSWFEGQAFCKQFSWVKCQAALCRLERVFIAAPNCFVGFKLELPPDIREALKRRSIRPQALPHILELRGATIDRYEGSWCDLESITGRNITGMNSLAEKKIALIGVGTIGGHLARMLVQSGAGSKHALRMYDTGTLSAGNIGRHALGFYDVGEHKVSAMEAELRRFHPDVKVLGLVRNGLQDWQQLSHYDLIVDATGEWNVQVALNDLALNHQGPKRPAILHAWVFMNGAGVQSFLNLCDDVSCFRCLRPDIDKAWRFPAGDPNHELNIQPANCDDGSYVPFSVDASMIAASLANKAALDWANGKPGYRLRTVAVDSERGRYQKPVSPPPASSCPACSKMRNSAG